MPTPLSAAGADRTNATLAAVVDEALAVFKLQGARTAAAFVQACGTGFALTCQVLLEPARWRAPAAPHPRIPT